MGGKKTPASPGNKAPNSGQYEQVGPRGGRKGNEVTVVKGVTLPPTTQSGNKWLLVDPSKNAAGRG